MPRLTSRALFAAAATLALGACADPRPRPEEGACPTWKDEVGPELEAACTSCHAGAAPAGRYDLSTYNGALGNGSDGTANAIAGDASSLLVTTIAPATAEAPHQGFEALHTLLARWVSSCDLSYFDTPIHAGGILNPGSDQFHGKELERRDWNFPLCSTCHGTTADPFGGSTAAPSCKTCHVEGPTACDTCHPARPTSNAHTSHLDRDVACTTCHVVPAAWNDEGHILRDGHADPAPAEVALSGPAATTIDPADRSGPPTYDATSHTCQQVYCHGAVLGNSGGSATAPNWTVDPPGPPACTSCHGQPPPSHVRTRCAECHTAATAPTHIDGAIELGDGTPGCGACHGSAQSPAPPRDLHGNTLSTALGVGAHQGHLQGPNRLASPVACAQCHAVPATVTAPGHLDSDDPAEVNAALGWDRTSQTCASAWCHGPARPVWTESAPPACGSCHGVPPDDPWHIPGTPLTRCTLCHGESVDAFGNIKFTGAPGAETSTHMNGVVDAP